MPSATMRRCCLIAGRDKPCALQSRRPSSPESHPNASVLRGSAASCLVSECPHFEHSNARLSKPFASSETEIVVIRIWHLGQRGRWIGNNSGSGFRMAFALEQAGALHSHSPMMAPDRAVIRNAISDFAILSVRFPTLGRELRHSQEFSVRHGRASCRPFTSFLPCDLEDVDTRDTRGHPVRRSLAVPSLTSAITGSSAFADDDVCECGRVFASLPGSHPSALTPPRANARWSAGPCAQRRAPPAPARARRGRPAASCRNARTARRRRPSS
jgi:hypothetical protein